MNYEQFLKSKVVIAENFGIELNSEYFADGLFYIKAMLHKLSIPTLFDFEKEEIKK